VAFDELVEGVAISGGCSGNDLSLRVHGPDLGQGLAPTDIGLDSGRDGR
jgi:hypothetical protein